MSWRVVEGQFCSSLQFHNDVEKKQQQLWTVHIIKQPAFLNHIFYLTDTLPSFFKQIICDTKIFVFYGFSEILCVCGRALNTAASSSSKDKLPH
jgi:hypothetical protein